MRVIDVTGMRIEVETVILAAPGIVWDLAADITRIPEWSPEVISTAWLDGTPAPRAGTRFRGRNRTPDGFEWTVTCVIEEAFRPGTFAWVVLADPGEPAVVSSFWHRDLEPVPGGTRIRESFTHGPGGSGLRWMVTQDPDRAEEIIAGRRRQLRDNIRQTMAGMKAAAEARQ
jgi:uncharacterized protein YndB with AHSA1/START domain